MSISEKANDLLNKFGSAQFDFMVWTTPDNLVARDKARQEISDYIAELEAANQAAVLGRIAELEKKVDQILYEIEIPNKYSLRDLVYPEIKCKIASADEPEVQE